MAKGSSQELQALHGYITKYYCKRLESALRKMQEAEAASADDEDNTFEDLMMLAALQPAELTAINNFLKQNDVTADPEQDEGLSATRQRLSEYRNRGQSKLDDARH